MASTMKSFAPTSPLTTQISDASLDDSGEVGPTVPADSSVGSSVESGIQSPVEAAVAERDASDVLVPDADASTDSASISPFQCEIDAPLATLPAFDDGVGSHPEPLGGTIRDGYYRLTQVTIYGDYSAVYGEGFILANGYIHRKFTSYFAMTGAALTGAEELGSYGTVGTSLAIDVTSCSFGTSSQAIWGYTATDTGLVLHKIDSQVARVETYARQ
jgi:hypothetical protein